MSSNPTPLRMSCTQDERKCGLRPRDRSSICPPNNTQIKSSLHSTLKEGIDKVLLLSQLYGKPWLLSLPDHYAATLRRSEGH